MQARREHQRPRPSGGERLLSASFDVRCDQVDHASEWAELWRRLLRVLPGEVEQTDSVRSGTDSRT